MNRKECVIFDIDGTLANLEHRRHLVTQHPKDWPEFFRRIVDDVPMPQTVFLNRLLDKHSNMPIFLASGRSENERADTEAWLARAGVRHSGLFMRPAGDYRKDTIIKEEILAQIRAQGYEPWLIFDDRECVTEMWRKNGLFVLQCDPNPSEVLHDSFIFNDKFKYPLTILVGPSGAGKSTLVDLMVDTGEWTYDSILSSDALRIQMTGNIADQSQNQRVFENMHELALVRLRLGLPVILDATHLRNADRIKAAKIVPDSVPVLYVVIDRPLAEKEATAGWRANEFIKGQPLIQRHSQVFKSNIKDIMHGDNLPNVTVKDMRVGK